ncbi:uncharacterized protein LOC135337293 isoform X2 [Halichondria panicea]|uniref:uncharacterized protein LOC135337293 isoform X2 n=1 Tax=Halichondria panicea TaxID=6063 RepID=UPI00312B6E72
MMAEYLWVALIVLFLFSNVVNSGIDEQCIETTPAPGRDSSGYLQAVNFTKANCPVSSIDNETLCYEKCLMPSITLQPEMDAYAECVAPPESENQTDFNRVKLFYHPPNGGPCSKFQSTTNDRSWHHLDEHIHFRRQGRVVEVFIVNVAAEHHDLIIVCLPTNTNSSVLEGCMNGSRSTLFVAPEQDSENTDSSSNSADNSVTDTDSPSTTTDNSVTNTDSPSTTTDNNSPGIATVGPVVLLIIGLLSIFCY